MSYKEKYRQWCSQEDVPLFLQAWWLDVACSQGKQWNVLLHEKDGQILASLVFHYVRKFGFQMILLPELTPYSGWWFAKSVSEQEKPAIAQELLLKLERLQFDYMQISLVPELVGLKEMLEKQSFDCRQRRTFVIKDISDPESVFNQFHLSKRRHIQKAEKTLKVKEIGVSEFCRFHAQQYEQKGEKDLYSNNLLMTICNTSIKRHQGKILAIMDEKGIVHAATFVVWDKLSAYYLLYCINPQQRSSGASTMMVYEMIKYLQDKTQSFDFEGGMEDNVADSYSKFGTQEIHYCYAEKFNSKLLKFLFKLYHKKSL